MFAGFPLSNGIGCEDRHGERHGFFPLQAFRGMFSHPGIEHLRPAGRGIVHVLRPSGVWVGRRSEWVAPAAPGELPPHEEGYQAERENADADETDEDGRG